MPLVTLEGIDGAGKYTQLRLLHNWTEKALKGPTTWFSEPNERNEFGRLIYRILRKEAPVTIDFESQRLFVLDRAEDVFTFLLDGLGKGYYIFAERFWLSTIAYGMLNGKGAEHYIDLHYQIIGPSMPIPDLTILLDISASEAVRRIAGRSLGAEHVFEKEETLRQARENYLKLSRRGDLGHICVVDGSGSKQHVFERVLAVFREHFKFDGLG